VEPKYTIAKRIAQELQAGQVVNIGIGIPTLVPDFLDQNVNVFLQSENGILGVGPSPLPGEEDPELVNAGKLPVTEKPGVSYFDSAQSFAMIRGGHVDYAILGALQVDETGLVANWAMPNSAVLGVGGAMDLMAGAKKVIVGMTHNSKGGESKIVKTLTYPITAVRHINMVVTELAVFEVLSQRLVLKELLEDITLKELRSRTGANFDVDENLRIDEN